MRLLQFMYETIWDMRLFNDPELWPTDDSLPFVWPIGGKTGNGPHGDYNECYVNRPTVKTQSIETQNKCTVADFVKEGTNSCLDELPGIADSKMSTPMANYRLH
ncbi:hypothetical protein F503_03414 [Ophiostoma piceae UAMH 11346]|uniref:DUF1996 domain-containing protein n=1 Tax=Ophiostoma piceae (strain UAMH 11346) TaxID=1262450 RepID=S3C2I2_OPHP1|nr:hypothetical protein F503_03414 [Ophiostoma piceae UAMH 11346]